MQFSQVTVGVDNDDIHGAIDRRRIDDLSELSNDRDGAMWRWGGSRTASANLILIVMRLEIDGSSAGHHAGS